MNKPFKKGDKVSFEIEGKQETGVIVKVWKVRYTDESIARISDVPNGPGKYQLGTHLLTRVQ